MKRVDWGQFRVNSEAIAFLKTLPRYRNTPLRSAFSRARVFATLMWARLLKIDRPIFVVLVTNNHCDLKCTYCYGDYGHRKGYIDYTTGQLMKMVDELWGLGTRLLTIHGGEAMLRKDITEVLNYCKLKGFYVSFNTNGLNVEQKIGELRCLDSLVVSLDGRAENNDKHRGAGNFATAVRAIEAGAAARIPTVISATLTRDNMHDMEYLGELAQTRGVRVQYSILYNSDDPRVQPMIMSESETRSTAQEILDLKRRGFPIYYSDNVLLTTIHWPAAHDKKFTKTDAEFSNKFRLVPCYHGKLKYQIDADGRVVECWATDYAHAPNIKNLGIAEAMRRVNRDKACYHCTLMANNEHNAFMHMSPRNLWNIFRIQVADSLKLGRKRTMPAPAASPTRLSDAESAAAAASLRAAAARAKAAGVPPVKKSGLVVVSPARAEDPGIPDHRAAGQ